MRIDRRRIMRGDRMTKNKTSPGPWVATVDTLEPGWINDANGNPVVEYAGCGSHSADWLNEADLKLALAAPELLEALRELHDFASVSTHFRYRDASQAAFDKAAKLLERLN